MMNAFRRNEPSEPAPPPRPPRLGKPLPPDPAPPIDHAPPPPHNHHNSYPDDDNEDAYSWGEDFEDYGSDPEEEYENQEEWTQDHNSNTIGYQGQETYEEMHRPDGDDEEFYEQPTNSPSQSFTDGGIVQQLQRELTRRGTLRDADRRPHHAPVEDDDDDDGAEDYEEPIARPQDVSVPPRPPRSTPSRPPPQRRITEPPREERPPPRPPALHSRNPPPIPTHEDDEDVYDEPDEDMEKMKRAKNKKQEEKNRILSRQLPPVPQPMEERSLPPTPKTRGQNRAPKLPPVPVQEPEETYEPMDAATNTNKDKVSAPSRVNRPPQPIPTTKAPAANTRVPPPPKDELERFNWYHKNIERATAESTLTDLGEDGMYLIRKSRRGGTEQQYTLTIYKQGRVYNLPIRKRDKDGKFALGAPKPNELDFESVPKLVDYFKTKLIMLNPKAKNASGSTRLVTPMPK